MMYNEEVIDRFYFRRDIGDNVLRGASSNRKGLYARSGVSVETGNEAVESIQHYVKDTYNDNVVLNEGGFGGIMRLPGSKN